MIIIRHGKKGYHLNVDGLWISHEVGSDIKAVNNNDLGVPHGATEWVSVKAIRNFWAKYRSLVCQSVHTPYRSIWGNLVKEDNCPVF